MRCITMFGPWLWSRTTFIDSVARIVLKTYGNFCNTSFENSNDSVKPKEFYRQGATSVFL